ncbi:MAG: hypothetical protein R2827_01955 [Bdellovibrionales bacterium]
MDGTGEMAENDAMLKGFSQCTETHQKLHEFDIVRQGECETEFKTVPKLLFNVVKWGSQKIEANVCEAASSWWSVRIRKDYLFPIVSALVKDGGVTEKGDIVDGQMEMAYEKAEAELARRCSATTHSMVGKVETPIEFCRKEVVDDLGTFAEVCYVGQQAECVYGG